MPGPEAPPEAGAEADPGAEGVRVPAFLSLLAAATHFLRLSGVMFSPPFLGNTDSPLSSTVGVPEKPPVLNFAADLFTQSSCLPSSTHWRNPGADFSPSTLPARSSRWLFFAKASFVSGG